MYRGIRDRCLVLASGLALAACGRFGIEQLDAVELSPASDGPEQPPTELLPRDAASPDDAAEHDATASHGASSSIDSPLSALVDAGGRDAGERDSGPFDATSAAAPRDAASPDAGFVSDASLTRDGSAETLPRSLATSIACSSYGGLIACSDFNGGSSGTTVSSAGAAAIQGGYLRASSSTIAPRAAAHVSFDGVSSGTLYLRFSLYVPSSAAVVGWTLARLGRLDASSDFGVDLELVRDGELELRSSAGTLVASGPRLARDSWQCVLLEVTPSDRLGSARVVLDGSVVAMVSNLDSAPPGGIAAAAAGIERVAAGQSDTTVFVDNVLLTSQPPGSCP